MRKPAIALKPLLPCEAHAAGINAFGGRPNLPIELDWPRGGDDRPLHFLTQINCEAFRGVDSDAPQTGTFFIFAGCNFEGEDDGNGDVGGAEGHRILYWPDGIDSVPERSVPNDIPRLNSSSHVKNNPWDGGLNTDQGEREIAEIYPAPTVYPRVPLYPARFDSDRASPEEEGLVKALPSEDCTDEQSDFLSALFDRNNRRNDAAIALPDGYPFRWRVIGLTAAELFLDLEDEGPYLAVEAGTTSFREVGNRIMRALGATDPQISLTIEEQFGAGNKLRAEARHWLERAAAHDGLEPVDPDATEEFASFIQVNQGRDKVRSALVGGLFFAIREATATNELDGLPQTLIDDFHNEFRWERSLTPPSEYEIARWTYPIQMFGDCGREDFSDTERVLLLQLPDSDVLNFRNFGNEVLRFYISREDLRTRSFDKAIAVFEPDRREEQWRAPRKQRKQPILPPERVKPAFAFKPLLPGEQDKSPLTYRGGRPTLPPTVEWPKDSTGRSMNFLMQINCANLPRQLIHAGKTFDYPPTPETGGLFIFQSPPSLGPDQEYGPEELKVLQIADQIEGVAERDIPDDVSGLPTPFDNYYDTDSFPCEIRSLKLRLPDVQPRVSLEVIPFASCDYDYKMTPNAPDMFYAAFPHEPGAMHEYGYVLSWLPQWHKAYRAARDQQGLRGPISGEYETPFVHVPQTYPWRWINIIDSVEAFFAAKDYSHEWNEKYERDFWQNGITEGAVKWYQRAAEFDLLERIPEEDASAYREWLFELDQAGTHILAEPDDREETDREWEFCSVKERMFVTAMCAFGRVPLDRMFYYALRHDLSDIPDIILQAALKVERYTRSCSELTNSSTTSPNPHIQMFGGYFTEYDEGENSELFIDIDGHRRVMISPENLASMKVEHCVVPKRH